MNCEKQTHCLKKSMSLLGTQDKGQILHKLDQLKIEIENTMHLCPVS